MCAVEKIIEIPGSVRFFFSDNNRTRLLEFDKSSVPPPPFEFAEVLQFYQAKRNVTFCKMDLFQFMMGNTELVAVAAGKAVTAGFTPRIRLSAVVTAKQARLARLIGAPAMRGFAAGFPGRGRCHRHRHWYWPWQRR